MASGGSKVRFNSRNGRVPLSYFAPLVVTSNRDFKSILPKNAVPINMGDKKQAVGYWNEQVRWRMQKGKRVDLPSKWHYYPLGTGPHADASYRERIQGVVWVSASGADLKPTNLGSRSRNKETITPEFSVKLPGDIKVEETTGGSRPNSRSQSRSGSKSRSSTPARPNSGSRFQSRSNSRDRSRSRSGSDANHEDLVAAVRAALEGMGITPQGQNQNRKQKAKSGTVTPKAPRKETDKPVWKRTPNKEENVKKCFGPRSMVQNFGDQSFVEEGAEHKQFPLVTSLVPNIAAVLFGSEITTKEVGKDVVIEFKYKTQVSKENPALGVFLSQLNAFTNDNGTDLNPAAEPFTPAQPSSEPQVADEDVEVEIMDEETN
ncbi:MAG: nucleocapsid protein [Tadarida brasiliensis bat alphacoronavirus 1]|nr:MAG: nucleocapsid protein [Tadarida brasiliensis bat alphacoronavirus 1]